MYYSVNCNGKGVFLEKTESLMGGGRNLYRGKVICLYDEEKASLILEWMLSMYVQ